MRNTIPILSKEQFETLTGFAKEKESDFSANSRLHTYGCDLLSSFLKEYSSEESKITKINNDIIIKKLNERVTKPNGL